MIKMEEKKSTVYFQLLLKSKQISQLSVHICDAQERQLTAITLFNYHQNTISFEPSQSHYYCLLVEPNNNSHIIDVFIPEKHQRPLSKETDFSIFQFNLKVFFKFQEEDFNLSMYQGDFQKIAKTNLAKVQAKAIKKLENQMFFRQEIPSRMTKTFFRKPKTKKNLTDLFFRNKKGEIKRAVNNSSNNFNKLKCIQTPKFQEKQEDFLPEIPKLAKMNTSIQDVSNCFSFLQSMNVNPSADEKKSSNKKEAFEDKSEQNLDKVILDSSQPKGKKVLKRQLFFKTLYRQTRSQLDQQKQTLQLLKQFNHSQLKPIKVVQAIAKGKKPVKKKSLDISAIYNSKVSRH